MKGQDCGQLTLFPADSHVSRSALPGSDEAKRMTVTSGRKCSELYRNCGPLGSLVKTLLGSSLWGSTRCFLIWKASATPARRLLFRLVPSTPRIGETGAQSWPTPTTDSVTHRIKRYKQGGMPLSTAVAMFPTPRASDYKGSGPAGSKSAEHDLKKGHLKGAILYANPQSRYYRTGQLSRWENPDRSRNLNDQCGGQLNPDWVEWLMAFPPGWTDIG